MSKQKTPDEESPLPDEEEPDVEQADELDVEQVDESDELTEEDAEDYEERKERAEDLADKSAAVLGPLANVGWTFTFVLASLVLRAIPRSEALADSLIESGLNLKKNATGADAIALSAYGDRKVTAQPSWWQSEGTKYETANGEEYSAKSEGHMPFNMYGVDVIFTLRKSAEVFEPIQAYLAAQKEIGNWAAWVREEDDKRQAVIGSDPPDGADGMVLDWNKAWEEYYQKITQEDLERQNKIGRLAELGDEAKTRVVLLVLGAFVAGMVAVLVIMWILSNFIADSSGTISLFAGLGGWLL